MARRRDPRGRFVADRAPAVREMVTETTRLLRGPRVGWPEVERHAPGCPRGDALRAYVERGQVCTYMNALAAGQPACTCTPLVHAWHRRPGLDYPSCERCGSVRPADGHADAGPCRGVVRVCVREPEQAAAP